MLQQQQIGELFGTMGVHIDFDGEMRGQARAMTEMQAAAG